MAASDARCSAGDPGPPVVAMEDATMVSELQWQGFAGAADSGIREALHAAGVDCAMPGRSEPEHGAAFIPGDAAHDQPLR
jgi:hypothetical protein